jgi:hypothetical protein
VFRDDVDLAAHQHGLAQGRIHADPGHGGRIDADLRGEGREQFAGSIEDRRPELAAHEILGLLDAALLESVEAEGWGVLDNHDRLDRSTGISGGELDEGN